LRQASPVLQRLFLAFALVACTSSAPPYTPAAGPVAAVAAQAKVGDFWEYFVRDAYSGAPRGVFRFEVVHVDPANTVVDVYRDGQRIDAFIYAEGWNPREMPLTNLQRFHYNPPFPAYEFPLEPGKNWYRVVSSTDPAARKTYRTHIQAKVAGWERVRVPAGDFDALKVVRYVYAGNAEFFNTQEEIVQTDWFAPAVNQVVRSEGNSRHVDTSRSGGGRKPLLVRGDWLIAELTRFKQ
jgi:hypothetical protein